MSIFDNADCFAEEFFFIEEIGAVVFGAFGIFIYSPVIFFRFSKHIINDKKDYFQISMRTFVALGANLKLSAKMRYYHRTMTKALVIQV